MAASATGGICWRSSSSSYLEFLSTSSVSRPPGLLWCRTAEGSGRDVLRTGRFALAAGSRSGQDQGGAVRFGAGRGGCPVEFVRLGAGERCGLADLPRGRGGWASDSRILWLFDRMFHWISTRDPGMVCPVLVFSPRPSGSRRRYPRVLWPASDDWSGRRCLSGLTITQRPKENGSHARENAE